MEQQQGAPAAGEDLVLFHLPGLFEFVTLYRLFLQLYRDQRDYFRPGCAIGSIYGAPADCLWGGGRVGYGEDDAGELLQLMQECGISARLTFSNSLLRPEHLTDCRCNALCARLQRHNGTPNGVIVASELLTDYLRQTYPGLYLVSSTTKVLTGFDQLTAQLQRAEFRYVVPDFRLNPCLDRLAALPQPLKDKVEFLCNECCSFTCSDRRACYEQVSRMALGEEGPAHRCTAPLAAKGYVFSRAMENPGFIGPTQIDTVYRPLGFRHFKLEGRSLGSALVLQILLHYLIRPEKQLQVREAIYLDSALDLF